jgi:glycosyltransferase involved in cell wall biosynthesis
MGNEFISVLHADDVPDWRGGQRQVMLLLEGLNRRGLRAGLVCAEGSELLRRCRSESIPALALPFRGELDIRSAAALAAFVKRGKFRIVHAHTAHSLSVCLLAKMIVPSTVLVATRHVAFRVKKRIVGALKYDNPLLDVIICVSDAVRRTLMEDGVDERRLRVIHGGIDVRRFSGLKRRGQSGSGMKTPRRPLVIGTVAAFTPEKDYPAFLEAARLVIQQNPFVRFVAVGDGPGRADMIRLSGETGLAGHFRFAETHRAVEDELGLFDIFVLASKREGLGLSILEAQCAGLPVVATAVGGILEIVEHGRNGLLVPPRDPRALAGAILRLAGDADLRVKLGRAAARSALKFSEDRMVDATIGLYRTLLDR